MHGLAWGAHESVDFQDDGVRNVALIVTCRFPLFGRGVACYAPTRYAMRAAVVVSQ